MQIPIQAIKKEFSEYIITKENQEAAMTNTRKVEIWGSSDKNSQ